MRNADMLTLDSLAHQAVREALAAQTRKARLDEQMRKARLDEQMRKAPLDEQMRKAPLAPLCFVDGTAGNGYDTLFLASCLKKFGGTGQVLAFDVQQAALEATRARLAENGLEDLVRLIHAGHEQLDRHLAPEQGIHAALFNLGFLPGSGKEVVTQADTSLAAAQAVARRLPAGGLLGMHLYTGHAGGAEEAEALLAWACALPYADWQVLHATSANKRKRAEHLVLISRRLKV